MIRLMTDGFSAEAVALSGQCFRWRKQEDGFWKFPADGTVYRLHTVSDCEVIAESGHSDGRTEKFLRRYLDLDTDYEAMRSAVPETDGYLRKAAEYGKGIRILRQPLWETMASFLISQNNNIPRIAGIIERLCGGEDAPFPSPQSVAAMGEEHLRRIGCGYRAPYIVEAAERMSDPAEESRLTACSPVEARAALLEYKGIGAKVAECICLYGLGKKEAFPRDVWVKRILERHYPDGFPYEGGGCAGFYQQLMFFYERSMEKV